MAEDHGHDEHGGGGDDHGKGGHKAHKSHGAPHGGGHEEHAGAPEWLISFADNVALLMGFFVILLAMNMGPKAKPQGNNSGTGPGGYSTEFTEAEMREIELRYGFSEAFHDKATPNHKNEKMRKLAEDHEKVKQQRARKGGTGNASEIRAPEVKSIVVPNLTVEFDANRADLSPKSRDEIAAVVQNELVGRGWVIQVKGHVSANEAREAERAMMAGAGRSEDDAPGNSKTSIFGNGPTLGTGAGFPLSNQRAFEVAAEMARNGLPWRHMRIVACSDMERAVARPNDALQGHRRNQRVDIIMTQEPLPADPLAQEPGQQPN